MQVIGLWLLESVKDFNFQPALALFLWNLSKAGEVFCLFLFPEHPAHLAKYMVIEAD